MSRPMRRIFAIPAALAAVSAFGLVAALLFNAPADWLWDVCIAAPLIAIVATSMRGKRADR